MKHLRKFNSRLFESDEFSMSQKSEELKKALEDEGVKQEIAKLSSSQLTKLMSACADTVEAAKEGEFDSGVAERRSYRRYSRINEGKKEATALANKFMKFGLVASLAGGIATGIVAVATGTKDIVPDAAKDGFGDIETITPNWVNAIPTLVITAMGLVSIFVGVQLGNVADNMMDDER